MENARGKAENFAKNPPRPSPPFSAKLTARSLFAAPHLHCPRRARRPRRAALPSSVGRGDHTPPPHPVGGGLRPAPPGKAPLHANSRCFLNASPHCVGADSCVRPRTPPRRTLSGQTHRSASAGPIGNIHRTQNGRGQSPAPTAPLRKGSCRGSAATGGVPALPGTTHAAPVGADAYIGPPLRTACIASVGHDDPACRPPIFRRAG